MTMPAPTSVTSVRVAPGIRRTLVVLAAFLGVGAVGFLALGLVVPQVRLAGIVLLVGAAAYAFYVAAYLRRGLIEFGGGTYRVREAFTDERFATSDVALVVPVDELRILMQGSPALVIVGTNGRTLVEINGESFGTATLEAFVSDLIARGAPLEHLPGRVTPAEFARRHPGVLSWPARHMVALNVALGIAFVAVLVVSVVVA